MHHSYYPMKHRIGGTKWTVREKLCIHWYPTPGCNVHKEIVGKRRAGILFERYFSVQYKHGNKANLLYWRSHPKEWQEILRKVDRQK